MQDALRTGETAVETSYLEEILRSKKIITEHDKYK